MMAWFRKKPLIIEAIRFDGTNGHAIAEWMATFDGGIAGSTLRDAEGFTTEVLLIHTLEGTMTVTNGAWIIRGVAGEFYPCNNEIFLTTYEPIASDR